LLGSAAGYEQALVSKNGKWETESTNNTQQVGLILQAKEETNSQTGETTATLSLHFGAAIGIGLVPKFEFDLPIYTEVYK
jgi:hypothetical protein